MMIMVERLKCKSCGNIIVGVRKHSIKECPTCESRNLEIFTFDEDEEIM